MKRLLRPGTVALGRGLFLLYSVRFSHFRLVGSSPL